jgi:hypothetical protein
MYSEKEIIIFLEWGWSKPHKDIIENYLKKRKEKLLEMWIEV